MKLSGFGVNLLTPFDDTNDIDLKSIEEQVEIYIKHGASYLVVGRHIGEFYTMNDDEILSVIETVVNKVNKRIPVLAHTGFNDTIRSMMLSIKANKLGVDALIMSSPYHIIGNEQGVITHFKSIAMSAGLPCYIENDPDKSGVNITSYIVNELSGIKNIVGFIENSRNINNYIDLASNANSNFEIICANDSMIIPAFSLGANSVISTVANICPEITKSVVDRYFEGELVSARELYFGLLKVHEVLDQEINPIPVKTAMNMLGYNVGDFRLPLGPMNPDYAARMATLIMDEKITKLEY